MHAISRFGYNYKRLNQLRRSYLMESDGALVVKEVACDVTARSFTTKMSSLSWGDLKNERQ